MDEKIKQIVQKIKQKKELAGIDSAIVTDVLKSYIKKTRISINGIKPSEISIIVKDVRKELRNYSGRFQVFSKEWKERGRLLAENRISELLATHSSTKERIEFYPEIRKIIASLGVRSILDLGCGLNPLALASPEAVYYASDINAEELSLIREFFRKNGIKGDVFSCDLRKIENCSLPEADICLIFKVLDILDDKRHKISESIIRKVRSNFLLISFSTKTLSGKPMKCPRRFWFERLAKKLGFSFEIIGSKNENFYLLKR